VIGPVSRAEELGAVGAALDRELVVVVAQVRVDDLDQAHEIRRQRKGGALERERKIGVDGAGDQGPRQDREAPIGFAEDELERGVPGIAEDPGGAAALVGRRDPVVLADVLQCEIAKLNPVHAALTPQGIDASPSARLRLKMKLRRPSVV
jgi:hypothetical protein